MSTQTPEGRIEAYLLKRCREEDFLAIKQTGMNGIPDRLILGNGLAWFVELKRPGCRPTALQNAVAAKIRLRGGVTLTADTKPKIDRIIAAMKAGGPPPKSLLYGKPQKRGGNIS